VISTSSIGSSVTSRLARTDCIASVNKVVQQLISRIIFVWWFYRLYSSSNDNTHISTVPRPLGLARQSAFLDCSFELNSFNKENLKIIKLLPLKW
jgi:hypothetical protein